jgi:hypothetical protein
MKQLLTRSATFCLLLLATACSKTEDATPVVDNSNDNLAMGNPSGAVASSTSPTNYLRCSRSTWSATTGTRASGNKKYSVAVLQNGVYNNA